MSIRKRTKTFYTLDNALSVYSIQFCFKKQNLGYECSCLSTLVSVLIQLIESIFGHTVSEFCTLHNIWLLVSPLKFIKIHYFLFSPHTLRDFFPLCYHQASNQIKPKEITTINLQGGPYLKQYSFGNHKQLSSMDLSQWIFADEKTREIRVIIRTVTANCNCKAFVFNFPITLMFMTANQFRDIQTAKKKDQNGEMLTFWLLSLIDYIEQSENYLTPNRQVQIDQILHRNELMRFFPWQMQSLYQQLLCTNNCVTQSDWHSFFGS